MIEKRYADILLLNKLFNNETTINFTQQVDPNLVITTTLEPETPQNACICELAGPHMDSHQDYHEYNLYLIVIALPLVATFGIITNFISYLIFTRGQLVMNSIDYYLAALAISDVLVDWCGLFVIAVDSARRFDELLTKMHLLIIPYILPLGYMAQMCSVYFTVFAAIDCYVSIRTVDSIFSRPKSTKLTIYIIVLFSFLYNCVTFWDLEIVNCVDYEHDQKVRQEICPTVLRTDPVYMQVYKVYCYALFMAFIPFLLLLALNILIIYAVCKKKSSGKTNKTTTTTLIVNRQTLTLTSVETSTTSEEDECPADGDSTITLVMVVILFLVCNSIGFAVNIIETFGNSNSEPSVESQIGLMYVVDAGNFLVVFNSSANFLIYASFSKPFRRALQTAWKKYKEKFVNLITSSKRRPASKVVSLTLTNLIANGKNQQAKIILNDSSTVGDDNNVDDDCATNDTSLIIENRKVTTRYQTCEIMPLNRRRSID